MKVAWMIWLPKNSGAAQQLRNKLEDTGDSVEFISIRPKRYFEPAKCLKIVEEMNHSYDAVALIVNSEMAEAIRNFKIKNYQKKGVKFARWFSLAVKEGGRELRWCQIG